MTKDQLEWMFEVVENARRGNQRAKDALLLILETERKAIITAKLFKGDVKRQDVRDGRHDVVVRVAERIEQLRATRAYFKWESRIINEVCKKYRRGYRLLAELSEAALSKLDGQTQFVGALDAELY
jgi:DNA-directed RNA polymerase specialized sigma24 family protein